MRRKHEHPINWRAIFFYGVVSAAVLLVAVGILYSYFEKQWLTAALAPEPIPEITILTGNSKSRFAASWVTLLTASDFSTKLVTPDRFEAPSGIVLICDLPLVDESLLKSLQEILRSGGGLAVAGAPPAGPSPFLGLRTSPGMSGPAMKLTEAVSPILARATPGHEVGSRRQRVALLEESSEMQVDARWSGISRAALAHYRFDEGRVVWLGFDPASLLNPADRQLGLILRTSFRWLGGQPVSDGAIGPPAIARTLTPDARIAARAKRFSFSVDRLKKEGAFSVRLMNRGRERIQNPTMKCWLPPNVGKVELSGSLIWRRQVSLVSVPEDGSILITLPTLAGYEDRLMRLRTIETTNGKSR